MTQHWSPLFAVGIVLFYNRRNSQADLPRPFHTSMYSQHSTGSAIRRTMGQPPSKQKQKRVRTEE